MIKIEFERALKPRFFANERPCFLNWHGRRAAPRDLAAAREQLRAMARPKSFGRRQPEHLRSR